MVLLKTNKTTHIHWFKIVDSGIVPFPWCSTFHNCQVRSRQGYFHSSSLCLYIKKRTLKYYIRKIVYLFCVYDRFWMLFFNNDYEQMLDTVHHTTFFKPAISSQIPLILRISLTSSSAIRRKLCGFEIWRVRLGPLSNLLV